MRPSINETMLGIAGLLALRGTCFKLAVGCVLVDEKGHILGTGYNGPPRGCTHCIEVPCSGATAPAGSDLCVAVHAEQNALLQCRNVDKIYACYTTHAPCLRCVKQLMNTSCKLLVFANSSTLTEATKNLWLSVEGHTFIEDDNDLLESYRTRS